MNSPTCSQCDCIKGCQSNPVPCPNFAKAIAQPKQPALADEYNCAMRSPAYNFDAVNKFVHASDAQYEELQALCLGLVSTLEQNQVAQPEQQTDIQQQNQQLRDQNTALDLRCAEYEKAAQAGQSAPVAWGDMSESGGFLTTNKDDAERYSRQCCTLTPLYTHPAPAGQSKAVARFCPGCGSVGEVESKFRDCCPDGDRARVIPASLARHCHDLFQLALKGACTHPAPVRQPLTDDEIFTIAKSEGAKLALRRNPNIDLEFARAIEAKINAQGATHD